MLDETLANGFSPINSACRRVFKRGRLSLGTAVPPESFEVGTPSVVQGHIELAQLAQGLGFAALWLRDVPFDVPGFGDVGQILDPFVCLGALDCVTDRIARGTASIILPLRHPAHVAKAAATEDVLSGVWCLVVVGRGTGRPARGVSGNGAQPF